MVPQDGRRVTVSGVEGVGIVGADGTAKSA